MRAVDEHLLCVGWLSCRFGAHLIRGCGQSVLLNLIGTLHEGRRQASAYPGSHPVGTVELMAHRPTVLWT